MTAKTMAVAAVACVALCGCEGIGNDTRNVYGDTNAVPDIVAVDAAGNTEIRVVQDGFGGWQRVVIDLETGDVVDGPWPVNVEVSQSGTGNVQEVIFTLKPQVVEAAGEPEA